MTTPVNPRFDGHGDPAGRVLETWLEIWASELQVIALWQQSLLGVQRAMFDLWACRFGGGVPIDA